MFIYLTSYKITFYRWTPTPQAATIRFCNSELKQRKVYIPDVNNSNQKFDVSLDRTLLTNITKSECLCFNSHCTNLSSQSTEKEKISTWDCHFWRPGCQSFSCLMHQSIPAVHRSPPPPHPTGLLRGRCLPCQSWGWGICKFCSAWGPGICQPQDYSQAFDMHAVSYQNISTCREFCWQNNHIGHSWNWLVHKVPNVERLVGDSFIKKSCEIEATNKRTWCYPHDR